MEPNKYKDVPDEQLIRFLRSGKTEVIDYLMDKYKNLVRRQANMFYLIGGETEDLIQEGMIGLFKAIQEFRFEKETSFYRFAKLCVTRQIYTAVEASNRKKHTPLNSYVPLDIQQEQSQIYATGQLQALNPETLLIGRENAKQLLKQVSERLSRMERQVLALYLDGMNYRQIAKHMGKSPKAIDNALQRIRGKIKSDFQ